VHAGYLEELRLRFLAVGYWLAHRAGLGFGFGFSRVLGLRVRHMTRPFFFCLAEESALLAHKRCDGCNLVALTSKRDRDIAASLVFCSTCSKVSRDQHVTKTGETACANDPRVNGERCGTDGCP